MYMSGPIFYIMCWWMHSIMCCYCWDNVATCLLITVTNSLWSMMEHTSLAKSDCRTFLAHVVFLGPPNLYCCSATQHSIDFCRQMQLDSVVLSGISSCPQFMLSLFFWNNLVPRLTPNTSVSRYRGLGASWNLIPASFLIIFFAMQYRSWYILFMSD